MRQARQAGCGELVLALVLIVGLGVAKPSTRLRMLPLAKALRQRGHDVSMAEVPTTLAGRLQLLLEVGRHDVVVLQKKLFPVAYVAMLRKINPRLVFDVDDAVMFHELERGQPVTGKYFRRFAAVAAASRAVVAGNAYVAAMAAAAQPRGEQRTTVLPTPIDIAALAARGNHGSKHEVTVGWIGTKSNLRQLMPLIPILRDVQTEMPQLVLHIVSDGTPDLAGVHSIVKPWRAAEEQADLHGFDVGIMPLEDSLWNRGKGGYKLLQYMAAGVPAIASPVGINAEIIDHGTNGFLAGTLAEWKDCLLVLARDAGLRHRMGQVARTTVEQNFSLARYLERYVAIVEECGA